MAILKFVFSFFDSETPTSTNQPDQPSANANKIVNSIFDQQKNEEARRKFSENEEISQEIFTS